MYLNEILVDRINKGVFPENTDSVVLSLVPELDILTDYMYTFRKRFEDTDKHIYNPLRVYLIKCNTFYYDNREIIEEMTRCIKDSWKIYNTMGNQMFTQRYNWGDTSDYVIIEFEELDVIYKQIAPQEPSYLIVDGTLVSYHLYYKPSTKEYFGSAEYSLEQEVVSVEISYTKKPTEAKFKKDVYKKFCDEYNIVPVED